MGVCRALLRVYRAFLKRYLEITISLRFGGVFGVFRVWTPLGLYDFRT